MSTDNRPVPPPGRTDLPAGPGGQQSGRPRQPSRGPDGRLIPPPAAAALSWHHAGPAGKTVKAKKQPVPVNDGGEVTHYEMECPECPDSGQWVPVKSKVKEPLCQVCGSVLYRTDRRRPIQIPWGRLYRDHTGMAHAAAVTAALGVTGLVADSADLNLIGEAAQFAAIPAAVAGSWWLTRVWLCRRARNDDELTDEVIRRRARTAGYLAVAAGVWVEIADIINFSDNGHLALAALFGLGVAGSRPYRMWVKARRANPRPVPPPVDEEPEDDTPPPTEEELLREYVLERWEKVSAKGRVLHGTTLENIQPSVGGWSAIIVAHDDSDLDPEKFDMPEPVRKIARAYRVGTSMVSIIADPLDANRAMILVQNISPLRAGRSWDHAPIDVDTGSAETMTLEDGSRGRHQFWRRGWGAVMELIAGCTGSGKSEYVNLLLSLERQSGRIVSWVGDPQMGQSLGDIRDGLDWFAPTIEEILIMLRCAVMVMLARNVLVTRMRVTETRPNGRIVERRVSYVDVTPDFPLLSITIDEAHLPMNDPEHGKEIVRLLALLSKSGRKANIKVRLAVQSPLLSELKNSVLRGQLSSGLVTVFRTADRLTGKAAWPGGKMPGDPSALPAEWEEGMTAAGVGYSSNTARMRMRADYAGDVYDLMHEGDTLGLELAVLAVAGVAYADRWKRLAAFDSMDPAELLGAGIPAGLFGGLDTDTDASKAVGGREAVLKFFAERWLDGERDPVSFGEVAAAVRDVVKTRACTNACNKLVDDLLLETDEGAYWLTESGAEQLGLLEDVDA